ncbi:MAG TPA: hypothetical protein VF941_02615 [Clostridia bacterium]
MKYFFIDRNAFWYILVFIIITSLSYFILPPFFYIGVIILAFVTFGLCTEFVVPADVLVKVKPGDKVRDAKTVIGVIN